MEVFIGKYPDGDEKRDIRIKIHSYDVWSMDHTLAMIILPMLKKLKSTKTGSPIVADSDVPHMPRQGSSSNETMQYDLFESDEQDQLFWDQYHDRWEWVMGEMIWAFEQLLDDDNDDQFWITRPEIDPDDMFEDSADDPGLKVLKWQRRGVLDTEARARHHERIQNGLRLFGTYYQGLWD